MGEYGPYRPPGNMEEKEEPEPVSEPLLVTVNTGQRLLPWAKAYCMRRWLISDDDECLPEVEHMDMVCAASATARLQSPIEMLSSDAHSVKRACSEYYVYKMSGTSPFN